METERTIKEYRLYQKRNGKYLLQVKVDHTLVDYDKGTIKHRLAWENVPTVLEGEQNET